MDTPRKLFRYIILIPHRDTLKPLEEYRQKLFSLGVSGAHSFPLAAPLAEVSRPFSREELKSLARNIRDTTKERDGKIISFKTAIVTSPGMSFFGPLFDLPAREEVFPSTARNKLLRILLPPVFCAAVVEPQTNCSEQNFCSVKAPVLSFRAASLANLTIRPLADPKSPLADAESPLADPKSPLADPKSPLADAEYSFEWKIDPPLWLPAHKRA